MPTIKKPNQYFDVKLYTGTNANTSINSYGFSPDLIWIKNRDNVENHHLVDSVRGNNKFLISNSTAAERTGSLNNGNNQVNLTSTGFDIISNGFNDELNITGRTYVAWGWDAGSSTVTNTSGSISSNVSVNTTAGFSIVTYTGNSTAGATIGHGLGITPSMIITKTSNTALGNWGVYHASLGATSALNLNNTIAASTLIQFWNNTAPTSSVFTVGTSNDSNGASTYVAYCFAEIAGFSKFGSYTGNGSTDGPFVYLGFLPRWVLIKQSSSAGNNWQLIDTARETTNPNDTVLFPNVTTVEGTGNATLDFLSNGFKVRTTDGTVNTSTSTYVYAAFAESPFKYSNAR